MPEIEEAVDLTKALIRAVSPNPSGCEAACA